LNANRSATCVRSHPRSLNEPGVGPIVAAQLPVAWSHHDRLRSQACFARLAGVAPVPASSGQTKRHRPSRGGDRQLKRSPRFAGWSVR
jgi:transposase